jgi:aldehyde:ferredoxin oxidoreductase
VSCMHLNVISGLCIEVQFILGVVMKVTEAKVVRINLSSGDISKSELDLNLLKSYFGGRGLASKILADEIAPDIDPLSIENKMIFSVGLLTGLAGPTTGRYMVVTKSPLTGTIASSNSGGFFGAELRKTGFFMIIVEGKAKAPVYISIKDDAVSIADASDLWGLDSHETTDRLVEAFGDNKAKVCCIGPAGENLSKISAVMNDKDRAAGRSGVGAVMGSKNLKGIVIKGTGKLELAEKERFREVVRGKTKMVKEDGVAGEGLPALGTKVLDNIVNQAGLYPANNFQFGTFDAVDEVCGEALVEKKYLVKNKSCFSCPISCGRYCELPDGSKGEGPEYETGWAYGADCGVNDLFAIVKANFMCNELGLDTISAGCTVAAAMELYEKGYIPKEDLENGPELKFGSSEAIIYYTRKMALREGKLGNLMAEGSYRLADAYGHPELSMTVKKQELPAYDPRGVQGHGLQYATSNRGGCHVRGYMISPEVLGYPEKLDSQELAGKPQWVKTFQDLTAVIDSLGFCLFSSFPFGADDYVEMLNAATGFDMTADEMMAVGQRIWDLERKFNIQAGILPDQDDLPPRFFSEPIPDGPQKGVTSKMKEILPEYYKLRGYDEKGYVPD